MKNFLFAILVILLIAGGLYLYANQSGWSYKNMSEQKILEMNDTQDTIMLIFVGDIMLSRSVGEKMAKENDYTFPFQKMAKWLSSADLTIGNLEGPISDQGVNVGSVYSFRAHPRAIEGLSSAGFDIVSVANNHMGDWASPAFEDTLRRLTEAGIDYIGGGFNHDEAYSPLRTKINDTRFCFFAYTDLGPRSFEASGDKSGMAFLEIEEAADSVEKYRASCDLIIVSLHFGDEYKDKANLRQKTIAKTLSDAGADLIIGHHSHIIGEAETLGDTHIFYSLGNFVFDQMFSEKTRQGIALVAEVKGKSFVTLVPHEIYINDDYQPELMNAEKNLSTSQ